jgi:secreted trypsin-like serine protease
MNAQLTMGALVCSMLVVDCAAPMDSEPVAVVQVPILNGSSDAAHRGVVALQGSRGQTQCTGTLIAPSLVLTAAHCGAGTTIDHIAIGASATQPEQTIAAGAWHPHPEFDLESLSKDIGVLELQAPAVGVAPYAVELAGPPVTGDEVVVVGFGRTLPPLEVGEQGQRYAGDATVAEVDETTLGLAPAPARPCSGDSGGPVLRMDPNGETLIGVTSYGDLRCAESAVATRSDAYADFLEPWLAPTSAGGCSMQTPTPSQRAGFGYTFILVLVAGYRLARLRLGMTRDRSGRLSCFDERRR